MDEALKKEARAMLEEGVDISGEVYCFTEKQLRTLFETVLHTMSLVLEERPTIGMKEAIERGQSKMFRAMSAERELVDVGFLPRAFLQIYPLSAVAVKSFEKEKENGTTDPSSEPDL